MQNNTTLINKNNPGFTLIELLFVVSIMALLVGVGYSNLRDFQRRQHLESAVSAIKADLRLAQEMALAGRKPADFPCNAVDSDLVGYRFIRDSSVKYRIGANCSSDPALVIVKDPDPLDSDINFNTFSGNSILFRALGRGVNLGGSPNVCLQIDLVASGTTIASKYIVVTETGDIVENTSCAYP